MTASFVGTPTTKDAGAVTNGNTTTINKPSGGTTGDAYVIFSSAYGNGGEAIPTSPGFTAVISRYALLSQKRNYTMLVRPHDGTEGSTFTITSAGSIGGIMATPILNYPEVGILGVYKIVQRPMVDDGEIVIRDMANMTITLDHRIVDGATAARFMNELMRLLQNPGLMLLEG